MTKKEDETNGNQKWKSVFIAIAIIIFVWVLAGLAAFIASLVCFGLSGSTAEKMIGVMLAILVGPFYWIYFAVNKKYCRKIV